MVAGISDRLRFRFAERFGEQLFLVPLGQSLGRCTVDVADEVQEKPIFDSLPFFLFQLECWEFDRHVEQKQISVTPSL